MVRACLIFFLALSVVRGANADLPDFTQIVDASAPAVVKILVEYESDQTQYQDQMEELPEYLRRFSNSAEDRLYPESGQGWALVSSCRKTVMSLPTIMLWTMQKKWWFACPIVGNLMRS